MGGPGKLQWLAIEELLRLLVGVARHAAAQSSHIAFTEDAAGTALSGSTSAKVRASPGIKWLHRGLIGVQHCPLLDPFNQSVDQGA
jgi:hypothetical protein